MYQILLFIPLLGKLDMSDHTKNNIFAQPWYDGSGTFDNWCMGYGGRESETSENERRKKVWNCLRFCDQPKFGCELEEYPLKSGKLD